MSRHIGWFVPGRNPVIYLDAPPIPVSLAFVWGVIAGGAGVALAVLAVLIWPVTP